MKILKKIITYDAECGISLFNTPSPSGSPLRLVLRVLPLAFWFDLDQLFSAVGVSDTKIGDIAAKAAPMVVQESDWFSPVANYRGVLFKSSVVVKLEKRAEEDLVIILLREEPTQISVTAIVLGFEPSGLAGFCPGGCPGISPLNRPEAPFVGPTSGCHIGKSLRCEVGGFPLAFFEGLNLALVAFWSEDHLPSESFSPHRQRDILFVLFGENLRFSFTRQTDLPPHFLKDLTRLRTDISGSFPFPFSSFTNISFLFLRQRLSFLIVSHIGNLAKRNSICNKP